MAPRKLKVYGWTEYHISPEARVLLKSAGPRHADSARCIMAAPSMAAVVRGVSFARSTRDLFNLGERHSTHHGEKRLQKG